MAAEAFAFQSKNHPAPSPTAWLVANGGSGAVVFLAGLAVALLAAAVETMARITAMNITAGLAMAGIRKNGVLAADTGVEWTLASPDASW